MIIPTHQKKYFLYGLITVGLILIGLGIIFTWRRLQPIEHSWPFEAIDTMKYSRDLAREKANDRVFDTVIDSQVKKIAETGATHVAIATPYDAEFLPMLNRWVSAARKYHLKVWFRGNFSGWEGWFDYPSIDRLQHIQMTRDFILKNPNLFEDGDVFSACPECENGGPGDPRQNGDVESYRKFLILEYGTTKKAFDKIGKKVPSNYFSMNADVARLVMDKATTASLDGIVTIDHYVADPQQLSQDIEEIAKKSGGKVILGEFGAPIPDITGPMSEVEQEEWIKEALRLLQTNTHVEGVSYWVGEGGSTQLWNDDGSSRAAVKSIRNAYFGKTKNL